MEQAPGILIVEDEFIIANYMQQCLQQMGYTVLGICRNYQMVVDRLQTTLPDLILLDITLRGKQSGVDVAHHIRQHYRIPFIFVTSLSDRQTIDLAKQTLPYAYLIKPFSEEDLYAAIETALVQFGNRRPDEPDTEPAAAQPVVLNDAVFVKHRNRFVKLKLDDIEYVEANDNYVTLFTDQPTGYMLRNSIKQMQESLPDRFFRIHRSYLINLHHLLGFDSEQVMLKNKTLPLSRNFYTALTERLRILNG
jgi:two-component system, LytTR family, response regulator LytT